MCVCGAVTLGTSGGKVFSGEFIPAVWIEEDSVWSAPKGQKRKNTA